MSKTQVIFVILTIAILSGSILSADSPRFVHEETKALVANVEDAAEMIEHVGEESFPEFRDAGSKFFNDDSYVFVWGLDGMRYVYPPDTSGEGENMIDLKDVNGKPIGRMIVRQAQSPSGSGWVHYQWPRPGENEPVWKSTYIKRAESPSGISGKIYLVGSGMYEMNVEPEFIVHAVDDAIYLLESIGLDALDTMRLRSSEFIFFDSYVFVKDMEGNEILNPMNPQLEGTNLLDLQDANGKFFVREELEILQTENECWMDYMWPKFPGGEPMLKRVFVKKAIVGDATLVVGAGYYPE